MLEKFFVGAVTLIISVFILPVAIIVSLGHFCAKVFGSWYWLFWAVFTIAILTLIVNLIHYWAFHM